MCENIVLAKNFIFYFVMTTGTAAVFYMSRFAKSRGIDFNSIFGLLEVYKIVFSFKNKKLSIIVLLSIYGNSLLVLLAAALHYWGVSEGCVFKLSGRWAEN